MSHLFIFYLFLFFRREHENWSDSAANMMNSFDRENGNNEWQNEADLKAKPQQRINQGAKAAVRGSLSPITINNKKGGSEFSSWGVESSSDVDDSYREDCSKDFSHLSKRCEHESIPAESHRESFRIGMAPAPITKDRLEASQTEKEVRKNMTTLRRNQDVNKEFLKDSSAATISDLNKNTVKSKNVSRSRPDSSARISTSTLKSVKSNLKDSGDTLQSKNSPSATSANLPNHVIEPKKVENAWRQKSKENVFHETSHETKHQVGSDVNSKEKSRGACGSMKGQQEKSHSDRITPLMSSLTEVNEQVSKNSSFHTQEFLSGTGSIEHGNSKVIPSKENIQENKGKNDSKDKISSSANKSGKFSSVRYEEGGKSKTNRGLGARMVPVMNTATNYSSYRGGQGGSRGDFNRRGLPRNDIHHHQGLSSRNFHQNYYYDYSLPRKVILFLFLNFYTNGVWNTLRNQ